jgi:chromate transporter
MSQVPQSKSEIFWVFTWLALQGFGGVLPVAERELVDKKRWYTREEFLEEWAVAQVLPGPNVVNLAIIFGSRHFGLPGALAAIAGMLLFPMLALLIIAIAYLHWGSNSVIAGAIKGMGAVAAGLIAGTSLKLASALKKHPLGYLPAIGIALLCFILVAWIRIPLVHVLLSLGILSIYLTYRRVKP